MLRAVSVGLCCEHGVSVGAHPLSLPQVILPAGAGAGRSPVALLLPLVSVALSMAVGAFGGLLLGAVLRTLPPGAGGGT